MSMKILRTTGVGCSMALALTLPLSNAWAVCTSTVMGTTAHVTCDSTDDTITVDKAATFFTHNADFGTGFNSITDWDSTQAGDQELMAGATIIFDDLGAGTNQVTIGSGTFSVGAIDGIINIVAGAGSNQLVLDSSASSNTDSYLIDQASNSITVGSLVVNPSANFQSGIFLLTGGGTNTSVVVMSTSQNSPLKIRAAQGTSNIYIDQPLQTQGDISILNTLGQTSVFVDDTADTIGRNITYDTTTGITGFSTGAITLGAGVNAVNLTLGGGGDTLHVTGTPSATITNTIDLGDGNDQCIINGSGLAANSSNVFRGAAGDDIFAISAVPANVSLVSIDGGTDTNGDILNYTGGTPFSATPGNGTLVPTNMNHHIIAYTSIEKFDVIFANSFE